ncbi:MAG: hypothetical protein ACR2HP_05495 [Ilumatobacteraceae bacterium]
MADDDEMDDGPEAGAVAEEPEDADEIDEDAEPDADELDDEFVAPDDVDDDDAVVVADEVEDEEDEEETAEAAAARTKRREEEEDDDEEILSPDDVEADLDRILKDRLVPVEEDDEDDADEPEDRSEGGDRLQPKRADEQLCPNCFLLVRATAPGCPVGDDNCPIFG